MSETGGPPVGGSRLWRQPRAWFLLGIPLGGLLAFVIGIAFTGGALAGLKYAETTAFCTSCHEMQTPAAELKESPHGSNVPGIRPMCGQCHIPPTFAAGLWRHVEASTEVLGHLTGKLDTPAKYEALRLQLAQDIWKELKANDSAECRSCHSYAAMDLAKQDPTAAKRHSSDYLAKTGKTCIDCHKGIAHHLPAGA